MRRLPWDRRAAVEQVRNDIWRYVKDSCRNDDEVVLAAAALLQMPEHDVRTLAQIHFSLSDEVGELLATMPQLSRQLATTTRDRVELSDGRIRGPVRWPATYARRAATGARRAYVTAPSQRAFDTPENHLLAFVLDAIVEQGNRTGWLSTGEPKRLGRVVAARVADAARWRRLSALAEMPENAPDHGTVKRVRTGRHRSAYAAAVMAWELHRKYVARLDRRAVREAVEQHALVACRDSTLLELRCAFDTMDHLSSGGWATEPTGLLRERHILHGERDGETVDVYYQHTPAELSKASHYGAMARAHGLRRSALRPDLVVRHVLAGGATRWVLFEVKSGVDSVEAMARSTLRDLLMYRHAFEKVLGAQSGVYGVGYSWGAELKPSASSDVALCTPDTLRDALRLAGLV